VEAGRLLTMEIEFSRRCNFQCAYCYVGQGALFRNELCPDELRDAIEQGRELGARKIIILGGEPTIYPRFLEMVEFIRSRGLDVEVFTNGSGVTSEVAGRLFAARARVVLKMNTLDEGIQDMLAGKQGSFRLIQRAFRNLREAGYPSDEAFLAVSTVICRQNADELAGMWQWLRDQDIAPYFEMITPQENAWQNEELSVGVEKVRAVFRAIAEIDRERYGRTWDPQPPLVGQKCMRHKFSCLVSSQGDVMPCVGVNVPIGNIRERKLAEIVRDSEVLEELKAHVRTIKGPCRTCEKASVCYGCRGAAYQMTGDYLASDPLCWKNAERQDEIVRLPVAAGRVVPQGWPMRVIDSVMRTGERSGEVCVTVSEEMPFVDEDGVLDGVAYFEMMAQSLAAVNGFKQLGTGASPSEGYLVGAESVEIVGRARVGDKLNISVYKDTRFGKYAIIKGIVARDDTLLARGRIKVWHDAAS